MIVFCGGSFCWLVGVRWKDLVVGGVLCIWDRWENLFWDVGEGVGVDMWIGRFGGCICFVRGGFCLLGLLL